MNDKEYPLIFEQHDDIYEIIDKLNLHLKKYNLYLEQDENCVDVCCCKLVNID